MADIMKNDSISVPPPPDEEFLRRYYDENTGEFTDPAQVHIYEILISDEIKAKKLTETIRSLDQFKDYAMELTERGGKRAASGDLGYIRKKNYPEIFDAAYATSVGAIGGPVMISSRHSIFYVIDKVEPQLKDYLGQKRIIQEQLIRQQKIDAITQWIDSRLKNTEVEVFDDVLFSSIDNQNYDDSESN